MLIPVYVVVSLIALAIFAVYFGSKVNKAEIYFFGVVLLLFMGFSLVEDGFSVQSGLSFNETQEVSGNSTSLSRTEALSFEVVDGILVNGVGLLCIVSAAGLALSFGGKKEDPDDKELNNF